MAGLMIRSGRCWIPYEWRRAVRVAPWRHSAVVAVTGVRTRADAIDVLAGHLPVLDPDTDVELDEPGEDTAADAPHLEDLDAARRMARRLRSIRNRRGVRELVTAHAINPSNPAVYTWRRAAPGQPAWRLYPDGSCIAVASFGTVQEHTRSGELRHRLIATRYYT